MNVVRKKFFMHPPKVSSALPKEKSLGHNSVSLVYQTIMTINQASTKVGLIVRSFTHDEERDLSDVESRLMHLGFLDGSVVRILKKSTFSKGPLLVEVRGRPVALSYQEAQLIEVEVAK